MPITRTGLRDVSDLTFIDLTTGKPFLYMDYALTSTNEHSLEASYARGGRGNPKRITFYGNKESTLTVTTQIIDWRFIALLSGAAVTNGATNIFKREILTAVDNDESVEITLSATPVANSVTIFPLEEDAVAGQEMEISVSDDVVTLTEGIIGQQYVAYYQFVSTNPAQKIKFKADSFPKSCKIIGDTLLVNEKNGDLVPFQMVCYKAAPTGSFTFTQASEGDPTSIEMVFDLQANENGDIIDYIQY